MSEPRRCQECGAELTADAPEGLCPRCLMQAGLGSQATAGTSLPPADPGSAPEPRAGSDSAARMAPTIRYSPSGRFIPPEPAELAARFPQLEILELLGQGGMGAVYKARQRQLNRLVALKILPAETAGDPAFAERFSREAQALAQLNHPHIVTVHDFGQAFVVPPFVGTSSMPGVRGADAGQQPPEGGTTSGLYYFLMEFVDGANLRRMLESGHLSSREALAIVPQVCDALQYAHDEGVVHRDIKPENILIDRKGRVKIADFGLAKLMGRTGGRRSQPDSSAGDAPVSLERLTYSGQVMGTPHYIAPEQVERPQTVDHRADIYSLGVVFYEMLTGELPLGRFAPPSQKVQVDVRLDEVVLRSLEKEPERRYQHASEVKTDVEHISRTVPPPVPIAEVPTGAPQTSVAGPTDLDLAEIRAQVRGPAIGLFVTGIIHLLLFVVLLLFALTTFAWRSAPRPNSNVDPYRAGDGRLEFNDSFDRTTGVMPGAGLGGPFPERPDSATTRNPRNPFGVADVVNPDGADVQAFAELVIDGDFDNANAGHWTEDTFPGRPDSLDGEWASRWNGGSAGTEWISGAATVKTVGDRVYILHRDRRQTFLIDARRAANNRLVGRHVNVVVPADAFPWVGRIVDAERIDGEWEHGRFDLRRKLEDSRTRSDQPRGPHDKSTQPDRGGER